MTTKASNKPADAARRDRPRAIPVRARATSSSAAIASRVDMDWFGGPKPTGTFHAPSAEYRADKDNFGTSRRARWFR